MFRDDSKTDWVKAKIFAVSSYVGSVPTFKVLVENGAVFSYVPPQMVRFYQKGNKFNSEQKLIIDDFWFESCKSEMFPCFSNFQEWKQRQKNKNENIFYSLSHSSLCYNNCPSEEMSLNYFTFLNGKADVFIKEYGIFVKGEYQFTLDGCNDNILLHLVILENGQFVFMPSHKILFQDNPQGLTELPKYKAVKETFSKT